MRSSCSFNCLKLNEKKRLPAVCEWGSFKDRAAEKPLSWPQPGYLSPSKESFTKCTLRPAGREGQPEKSRVTAGRSLASGPIPGSRPLLGLRCGAQRLIGTVSPKTNVCVIIWKGN